MSEPLRRVARMPRYTGLFYGWGWEKPAGYDNDVVEQASHDGGATWHPTPEEHIAAKHAAADPHGWRDRGVPFGTT